MPDTYRIFDTIVRCEFALPELPEAAQQQSVISIKLDDPDHFDASGFEMAFEWLNDDSEAVCWCERRHDEYLFVFPELGRFHIAPGLISCLKDKDTSMPVLRHMLLDQIIPRYLASFGKLVLHASAVTLENGKSVAFVGNSGFGKSTLASSFHNNGAALISDDCIQVDIDTEGATAIAAYKSIRLFPDSVSAVFAKGHRFTDYLTYSDKQQLILHEGKEAEPAEPRVLDAMFLLDDPKEIEQGESVCIKPMSGSASLMAMIYCAFSLDPSDKQLMARNFRIVGQAIGDTLGVYSLRYPRDHDLLPEVRAAVRKCVGASA